WRPLMPTLFPYTTLFRSLATDSDAGRAVSPWAGGVFAQALLAGPRGLHPCCAVRARACHPPADRPARVRHRPPPLSKQRLQVLRSEEHTSELQSRENLVC